MPLAALEARIDELVLELAQFHGYRTVWLGERGELIHAEPEDMLEVRGFVYVGTLLRPSREELTAAALKMIPVDFAEPVRQAIATWAAPAGLDSNLVPAL